MAQANNVTSLSVPPNPVVGWASHLQKAPVQLQSMWDAPFIQATASGRAAIFLALRALGVKSGDPVLVPSYHCNTMVAPIVALRARPVFYPVSSSGAPAIDLMDPAALAARAMIVPHY